MRPASVAATRCQSWREVSLQNGEVSVRGGFPVQGILCLEGRPPVNRQTGVKALPSRNFFGRR